MLKQSTQRHRAVQDTTPLAIRTGGVDTQWQSALAMQCDHVFQDVRLLDIAPEPKEIFSIVAPRTRLATISLTFSISLEILPARVATCTTPKLASW